MDDDLTDGRPAHALDDNTFDGDVADASVVDDQSGHISDSLDPLDHMAENFGLDASYQFNSFRQRTQTQSDLLNNGTTDRVAGTYRTNVHIPGIGLHYKF